MDVSARRDRGFTLIDLAAAIAVLTVLAIVVMQVTVTSRNAARVTEETRLASALAQGAFERARSLPPGELASGEPLPLEPPPEASELEAASLEAVVVPWHGDETLKHVKITFTWQSCRGGRREVVREGLVSDKRVR